MRVCLLIVSMSLFSISSFQKVYEMVLFELHSFNVKLNPLTNNLPNKPNGIQNQRNINSVKNMQPKNLNREKWSFVYAKKYIRLI